MVRRIIVALAIAVSGGVLLCVPAHAQGRPTGFFHPSHGMQGHSGHGRIRGHEGRGFRHFGRRGRYFGRRYVAYPYPYFWPYAGDYERPPEPPPYRPPVVVVRQPAPAAPPAPPAPSLLLEYRDGQWVRVPVGAAIPTSVAAKHRAAAASTSSQDNAAIGAEEEAKPVPFLPHAVLVFRNGRRLQLQRYEIRNGFIYTGGDYWDAGSPARKIAISELNVPATLRLNQKLGSKFHLPSIPDEVFVSF